MSHHIVEAKELYFSYPDGTSVLKGVSFRITHGEAVALIGANGAGKSTLLLHLNGYLFPMKGEVRIGDFPVTKETRKYVRRSVGMVFQDPDDQLFMPTVFEDVAFGPLNMGLPNQEIEKRVMDALSIVGASHLRDRPPYHLSGGEKRSVCIASVLSMAPDVLIMDEPTSNLDPANRRRVINLLKDIEHTRIIATHDLDLALEVCSRALILHDGRVTADGPAGELLQNSELLSQNHLEKPLRLQGCPVCGRKTT